MNKCKFCNQELEQLQEYYRHVDQNHQIDLKRLIDGFYGDV